MTFSPARLKGSSFTDHIGPVRPRLVVSVYGPPKTGKTTFALTAPGPVCYQGIDVGHEGVIEPFVEAGKVYPAIYEPPNLMRGKRETDDAYIARVMTGAREVWRQWDNDYAAALEAGAGTIVWDRADQIYNVLTVSLHGRLNKIMPRDRGIVFQTYAARVQEALKTKTTSIVLVHSEKEVWVGDKSTGRFTNSGYKETGYLAQLSLHTGKRVRAGHTEFTLRIVDCRPNRDLEGEVLTDADFPTIAQMVLPGVDPEVWYS